MLNDNFRPEKFQLARQLRRNPTPAQRHLWQELRGKQMGARVRRQAAIQGYVADFYCPKARLIIEINGSSQTALDKNPQRDERFQTAGFAVMHFSSDAVLNDTRNVVSQIRHAIYVRVA